MSTVKKVFLGIDSVATGKRIHDLMKCKGLSMKAVSEEVLVSQQSVWKWCKGQTVPSLDNMVILSRILGVPMDDIIVVNENIEIRNVTDATQKNVWIVTTGRAENASVQQKSKDAYSKLGHNMFMICRESRCKKMSV